MNENIKRLFEKTYAENVDPLFRFTLYRVSDKEQAMDIVEDAYMRLWETLLREDVAEPRALLYRITRNLIIDWYKKKKSIPTQSFSSGDDENGREVYMDMFEGDVAGAEIMSEARIAIEKIKQLEPIYREVVYLRFVEELGPKEIAEIIGESANVISVRINRGLKILKSQLGAESK